MSNLSVIPEVKVEASMSLGTAVVSSSVSTSIACLKCGHPKGVYSYFGSKKDVIFTTGSCFCAYNAPNPGGEDVDRTGNFVEMKQRRLLSDLYKHTNLEEMRMAIPITPARNEYRADFRDLLEHLYTAKTITEARRAIELYASSDEMVGAQ